MGRKGVTYDIVSDYANIAHNAGTKVTVREIRRLTGTGSHNTILSHLNRWRARKYAAALKDHVTEFKDEIEQDHGITMNLEEFAASDYEEAVFR